MPVHTWVCENCDTLIPDQYHPLSKAVLGCPVCGLVMERSWQRDSRPLFRAFTADDGTGERRFTSVGGVHRYERETERKADGGEGQRIVFRDYSQDSSNRDVNTLQKEGYQQIKPPKQSNIQGGQHPGPG